MDSSQKIRLISAHACLFLLLLWLGYAWMHPGMPREVNVNGILWEIHFFHGELPAGPFSDPSKLLGNTDCATHVISIDDRTSDAQIVLVHELTHAMVCVGGNPDNMYYNSTSNDTHEGVYHLADVWTEVLRRNRQLAVYLGEAYSRAH